MSTIKEKIATRSSSKQTPIKFQLPTAQKQPQTQKTKPKNEGIKRPIGQATLFPMFIKKQQTQMPPQQKQVLYSIKQLLKQTSFNQILQKCPKVKQLRDILCSKSFINQKLVYSCLDKYFHGNTTSLWCNKYAPRQVNELFQPDFAQKIKQWIKDFYYFKKEALPDDQLSFLDDQLSQSYSQSMQIRMNQYGWNCQALILKGRNGVGKTSLLKAIAKSMKIKIFQYASDVDQLQKMKQLLDGSQSQVVTNLQPKKKQQQNNKLIKQNNSITMFISQKSNKKQQLQTNQPKRLQIFRNFTQYFPTSQKIDKNNAEDNYFKLLFNSIDKTPIPYILTTDRQEFYFRQKNSNQKISRFDQIQFVQNTIEDLTYLYWTIYQIQSNLSLNITKKIKKQNLFQQLNLQINLLNFELANVLQQIRQLVVISNKKPLYISKYLQFKVHFRKITVQNSLQNYSKKDNYAEQNRYFIEAISQVNNQIISNIGSDDLVNNIEWVLYQKKSQKLNTLEQTATDQSEKQQKIIQKTACKQQQIITQKKPTLKQIRRQLDLQIVQNYKVLQNDPLNFQHNNAQNTNFCSNIPTNVHIKAKKQIMRNVKNKIKDQKQKGDKKFHFNINQKQFYLLPLIFSDKRSSRSLRRQSNQPMQEILQKFLNSKQIAYMQKFGKFIITS